VKENSYKAADLLIKKGADINCLTASKRTPLFLATLKGNKELVQLLLDNECNHDLFCEEGLTPLHIAI